MKTQTLPRFGLLGLYAVVSAFGLAPAAFSQGSLTPPGAPAPTMKSLDQLEPRTPISSAPFTISTSGSYYLTTNLTVTTGSGVIIEADDVTLDLNGFTISSTASAPNGSGILIPTATENTHIKNGGIRGTTTLSGSTFTTGGFSSGISCPSSITRRNVVITDMRIHGMAASGIIFNAVTEPTFVVERCTVSVCAGIGIQAHTVRGCAATSCGILGINASVVSDSVGTCVTTGVSDDGIRAVELVANSTGTSAGGAGIRAPAGTVSYSRGTRSGGVAIEAGIAIGCTVGAGTVTSANKFLGTP